MKLQTKTSIFLVIILSLSMIGCSVSSVISEIEIAETVVGVSIPVVAAFSGTGAAVAQQILTGISGGLGCVLTAAQAPGATTTTVGVAFDTCFGTALEQNLPAGTPAYIVAAVEAAVSIAKILVNKYGEKASKLSKNKGAPIKLSYMDRRHIKDIQAKLSADSAQFKK